MRSLCFVESIDIETAVATSLAPECSSRFATLFSTTLRKDSGSQPLQCIDPRCSKDLQWTEASGQRNAAPIAPTQSWNIPGTGNSDQSSRDTDAVRANAVRPDGECFQGPQTSSHRARLWLHRSDLVTSRRNERSIGAPSPPNLKRFNLSTIVG